MFGVYQVRKPHANPLREGLEPGEAALSPWVRIDKDVVTLITPHVDLGQGAHSVQALILAEELDIEFGQFRIDPGTPAPAYYNRALANEQVPFLSHDTSFQAEAMRGAMGGLFKVMGVMVTGGSSTVPDSFDKLREAGAVARETLKLAASKKTGVPAAKLRTARGAVQLPDGNELKYTERVELAATLAAAELCSGTEFCPDCDYVYYEAVAKCPRCGEPHPFHPQRRLTPVRVPTMPDVRSTTVADLSALTLRDLAG